MNRNWFPSVIIVIIGALRCRLLCHYIKKKPRRHISVFWFVVGGTMLPGNNNNTRSLYRYYFNRPWTRHCFLSCLGQRGRQECPHSLWCIQIPNVHANNNDLFGVQCDSCRPRFDRNRERTEGKKRDSRVFPLPTTQNHPIFWHVCNIIVHQGLCFFMVTLMW